MRANFKIIVSICRGRCPHRPKTKKCAYIHTLKKCFGAGPSGGNVLVPARTLRRSRLKGRCRQSRPLKNPPAASPELPRNILGCYRGYIESNCLLPNRLPSADDCLRGSFRVRVLAHTSEYVRFLLTVSHLSPGPGRLRPGPVPLPPAEPPPGCSLPRRFQSAGSRGTNPD